MAEKRKLEFFLLRYVPDAVKGEFVNIGLVMIETSAGGGFADMRFTRDWRRLLCSDPQADLDWLQAMENEIRKRVVEVRNCEEVVRVLNESFSNAIQLSGVQGCLTDDPAEEIEKMARIYLESTRVGSTRALSGRETILEAMRDAWKQSGLTKFMVPIPVRPYTGPGDSFAFDFGYALGEEIRLFHAVSLKARVDAAVTLASRYPKIAQAMSHAERSRFVPSLTAVVDDDLDKTKEEIGFALGMMQENGIRVAEVREMPRLAAEARQGLGL